MKILTEILLLAFAGFLNLKHAGGQPDWRELHHLPVGRVMLTMNDRCIHIGRRRLLECSPMERIPLYMLNINMNPHHYHVDVYLGNRHFATYLLVPQLISFTHVPANHTPKNAHMNIGNGEFYLADQFEPYDLNTHPHHYANENSPGKYPATDHIYVTTPGGIHKVYSSSLRRLSNTGEDHSYSGTSHVLNMIR
ncbi:uncharacterized protein LOC117170139 [Belonocnema kinseyi]|uniref:uncharacterized protein LOC117170139 n=1 Tax=Belonocnema kinseyi TaxID=2817044 RepID=UPI00143D7089|nr:uncharacterized protein LOC117170139 [Belonocnema kinseyi]